MPNIDQQLQGLMAGTDTPTLMVCLSLIADVVEAYKHLGEPLPFSQRMAHVWTCEELERRFPEVEAEMTKWAETVDPETIRPYGAVLLEAIERAQAKKGN